VASEFDKLRELEQDILTLGNGNAPISAIAYHLNKSVADIMEIVKGLASGLGVTVCTADQALRDVVIAARARGWLK
jgi:hypothetical protein